MDSLKMYFKILLFFCNWSFVESCAATAPGGAATTTMAPITASSTTAMSTTSEMTTTSPTTTMPLRTCSPDLITLGTRNDAESTIDVTTTGLMSTQIGDTQETTSTMQITCTADENNFASMTIDGDFSPITDLEQTNTITVTCNSADMMWIYEANGVSTTVTEATCLQV
ncbi:unnamed protein product [Caenorhabditis brenneri]